MIETLIKIKKAELEALEALLSADTSPAPVPVLDPTPVPGPTPAPKKKKTKAKKKVEVEPMEDFDFDAAEQAPQVSLQDFKNLILNWMKAESLQPNEAATTFKEVTGFENIKSIPEDKLSEAYAAMKAHLDG